MAVTTIDNLDLDDDYELESQQSLVEPDDSESEEQFDSEFNIPNYSSPQSNSDSNVMNALLQHYGIKDKNNILFDDGNGIQNKNWDDLDFDEKLNILKTSYLQPERDLDDSEISLINDMRQRNMSPNDYMAAVRLQGINDYAQQVQQRPLYAIDDLTDDEIFILDLLDKIEDISDAEISDLLSKAKENEDLFKRQTAGIRASLKQQEDLYLQDLAALQEQIQQQQRQVFIDNIENSLVNFDKVGDLDLNLDDTDKDNIMSFIFNTDETGMSTLGRALNDPNMLVKLSWFALYGDEAFNTIQNYFANEIKKANNSGYLKGLADGKRGTSTVVYARNNQPRNVHSIDDIYG